MLLKGRRLKQKEILIFSKLHKENNWNNKNVLIYFIFYLLYLSFFFSDFTFHKEALYFIMFILSLCSNMLTLESICKYTRQKLKKHVHFKILSRDEVFTRLLFFFSSRDETSFLSFWRDEFILRWNFILTKTDKQ